MVGLPFTTVLGDGRKAPKGKLPYVDDDGVRLADSTLIIEHFERKLGSKSLDHGIDPHERARAHVLKRMLEESLYFSTVWARWAEPQGWEVIRGVFRGVLSAPLRLVLPPLIRRVVLKQTMAQGIGRHSREEIYAFAVEDIRALATMLGEGPFALGDTPRTIDATVYSFVSQLLRTPFENPAVAHAKSEPALARYLERMDARFALSSIPVLKAAS
jgi:glutathione S-transferase